jgi:hypothetical protein
MEENVSDARAKIENTLARYTWAYDLDDLDDIEAILRRHGIS